MSKIKDINRQCTALRNNGIKCTMIRMIDTVFCYTHNPAVAEQRKESLRRGQSRRFVPMNNRRASFKLETLKDARKAYASIVNELSMENGDRTIKRNASIMIQGIRGFVESVEKDMTVERLEEMAVLRDALNEKSKEKSIN